MSGSTNNILKTLSAKTQPENAGAQSFQVPQKNEDSKVTELKPKPNLAEVLKASLAPKKGAPSHTQ